MEFHNRLQMLRKQRGLTQEELAQALFVSRAAVSKWESGRGLPGIDSLKEISKFFSVSIDLLLSGEEILTITEENTKQQKTRNRRLVYGLLDVSAILFLFLPLFSEKAAGVIRPCALPGLTGAAGYLRILYWCFVAATILSGLLMLAQWKWRSAEQLSPTVSVSLLLSAAGALLFIASTQPYAAALVFMFLLIKALMLIKLP